MKGRTKFWAVFNWADQIIPNTIRPSRKAAFVAYQDFSSNTYLPPTYEIRPVRISEIEASHD